MTDAFLDEAVRRIQAAALEPRFAAVQEGRTVPLDVLEVGDGRWVSSFDLTKTRFSTVDPGQGADSIFPYDDESFDLVFSVDVMQHKPVLDKRVLISEMWRVTRVSGQLIFLQDFVFEKGSASVYPMPVLEFVNLILKATAGQVILDHVETLRYPRDNVFRSALISLSKLGVPKPSPKRK